MQICFHVIKYQINVFVVLCFDDIEKSNDVLMSIQFLQKHNLSKGSLCISSIVKSIKYFFQSNNLHKYTCTVFNFLSTAFQTIPYAPLPNFYMISNFLAICGSISSVIKLMCTKLNITNNYSNVMLYLKLREEGCEKD